jgi:hypothetical protein
VGKLYHSSGAGRTAADLADLYACPLSLLPRLPAIAMVARQRNLGWDQLLI